MSRPVPGFLPQIRVHHVQDPACPGTERPDDDRAAAGREVRCQRQASRSGGIEERQPAQVQDKPLGPVINDPGRVDQEPGNGQTVQVAGHGEYAYPAVVSGVDLESARITTVPQSACVSSPAVRGVWTTPTEDTLSRKLSLRGTVVYRALLPKQESADL
jgi:hypothetical protein